jgi:hypothetical protein
MDSDFDFKMMAGADELKRNFINARNTGWVVIEDDEKVFNVDYDTIEEFVRVTQEIVDMDGLAVNAGGQQWGGAWNEGMKDGVFAYFGSTWYLHYTLKDLSAGGASVGNWGMIRGPQEFYWGGTFWFGSKVAAADDDKAAAVRQIIEFFCVNDDELILWMEYKGDFPAKKAVAQRLADGFDGDDFFLYDTNYFEVFIDIADRIDITKNITKYDDVMNGLFDDLINAIFANGEDLYDAVDTMSEGVRERAPTITVY